jgi:hypothetical protein
VQQNKEDFFYRGMGEWGFECRDITTFPLIVILSERSESKDLLHVQADPSAALGMTIEEGSG